MAVHKLSFTYAACTRQVKLRTKAMTDRLPFLHQAILICPRPGSPLPAYVKLGPAVDGFGLGSEQ